MTLLSFGPSYRSEKSFDFSICHSQRSAGGLVTQMLQLSARPLSLRSSQAEHTPKIILGGVETIFWFAR